MYTVRWLSARLRNQMSREGEVWLVLKEDAHIHMNGARLCSEPEDQKGKVRSKTLQRSLKIKQINGPTCHLNKIMWENLGLGHMLFWGVFPRLISLIKRNYHLYHFISLRALGPGFPLGKYFSPNDLKEMVFEDTFQELRVWEVFGAKK